MTGIQVVLTLLIFTVCTTGGARIRVKEEKLTNVERDVDIKELTLEESARLRKRTVETGGHGNQIDDPANGLHPKDKEFVKEENNEEDINDNGEENNGKGNGNEENESEEEREINQNTQRLVIFERELGGGYQGDMALDNITIKSRMSGCLSNPCLNGGACTENADDTYTCQCTTGFSGNMCEIIGNKEVSATFEDGTLGFLQQDDNGQTAWLVNQGNTPSNGTGPTAAVEGVKYAYFEASLNIGNDSLISSGVFTNILRCLQFSYNMYGAYVEALNVKTLYVCDNTKSTIWTKTGDQGQSWKTVALELSSLSSNYKVIFEGVSRLDFRGDIAIDNVTMSPRSCGCASNPCLNGGACTQNADFTFSCQCTNGFSGTLCDTIGGSAKKREMFLVKKLLKELETIEGN